MDMDWRETCFCWCQWSLDIQVSELETSDALLVRAMDEAMNIQPRDIYWSVLGMMNNPWFRIVITNENGTLKFEHPTHPVLNMGGWMERVKKEGGDLLNGQWGQRLIGGEAPEPEPVGVVSLKAKGLNKSINLEEFKKHEGPESPWFVINGEVYDGTPFLEGHPGGAQSIISAAGTDVSEDFLAIREYSSIIRFQGANIDIETDSETATAMMSSYHVGTLDKASVEALKKPLDQNTTPEPCDIFLNPRSWKKAELRCKKVVSHDTRIYTFALENDKQILGLPTGQHVMLKVPSLSPGKENIIRSYTPISQTNSLGTVDMLVKIYFPTPTTKGGKMTMAVENLAIGSTVEFKGPVGKFTYLGKGKFSLSGRERSAKSFRMICGGSGITPIFQVLRAVVQDPDDATTCILLDGNRSEKDILCKDELDAFAAASGDKCKIIHALTEASSSWTGLRGRLSKKHLQKYVSRKEDTVVLICGPRAMEKSVRENLLELGWDESDLVFY